MNLIQRSCWYRVHIQISAMFEVFILFHTVLAE